MSTGIAPLTNGESFVLAAALRYALPRRTYALKIVADEMIRAIPRMTPEQRGAYIRELDMTEPVDFIAEEEMARLRKALAYGDIKVEDKNNGKVQSRTAEESEKSLRAEN